MVEIQRVQFTGGTFPAFHLVVDDDFQLEDFAFHFQHGDGSLMWRKDNYPGHEELGPAHIHRESEEKDPEPFREVDLEAALDEVREWRTMP